MVLQGGLVNHLVLFLLMLMSSVCWAVIFLKWSQFRKIHRENQEFLQIFSKEQKLDQIYNAAAEFTFSPIALMFIASYKEVVQFRQKVKDYQEKSLTTNEIINRMSVRLNRVIDRCINQQLHWADQRLNILATISSSGPFIGLFGTVLGIIDSFQNIGSTGVTSLAVVAPGLSEALIATAAGLLAAIPSLVAYNHFRHSVRELSNKLRSFALDLNNRIEWLIT